MRVLFVTRREYLPQAVGGAEWSTHYLCAGLLESGHEPAVLCGLLDKGWLAVRNKIARKLTGTRFPGDTSMGYPVYRGWTPAEGVTEVTRHFRPDIIVVIGAAPNPFQMAMQSLKTGLPVAYQLRDTVFASHGGNLDELGGVTFISNSEFTRQQLKQQYNLESGVVLPPIFPEKCQVAGTGNSVLVVNPDPRKGGELAVSIAEKCPHIPFIIQESWSNNDRLEELIKRASRCPNIDWRAPTTDVREFYQDARLLLAPSQGEEAWGRVASEAHVSGIPVVASRSGGLPEAVGPGGIVLERDAPIEEWVAAVNALWQDDSEWTRYSNAAREYAQRADMEQRHQVGRFCEILKQAISTHKSVP